ncbi:hypothetical protein T03_2570 [Trichinella britovi]|uniref:Uncharacterized protein n=1 Tax=Trichinella britovi TaxID=45882 RepID=A0A0V1B535_TRIBR|nr:hypothetical protein T03_2570 [Trichinella britovi]
MAHQFASFSAIPAGHWFRCIIAGLEMGGVQQIDRQIAAIVCGICEGFMIKVLYVVTGPYCTWWTCGHHVERPIEDFQSFTFWNVRCDLKIIFHPHSNVHLEYRITVLIRMTSSAGYGCCFNYGVAGCATLLASTIRLLQPLILCSFFTVLATHRS